MALDVTARPSKRMTSPRGDRTRGRRPTALCRICLIAGSLFHRFALLFFSSPRQTIGATGFELLPDNGWFLGRFTCQNGRRVSGWPRRRLSGTENLYQKATVSTGLEPPGESVSRGRGSRSDRHHSAVSKRSFLWTELPKFFEFFRQANMQWAFPTQSVEKRFGLRQRAASGFFSSKEIPPCIHHVPFVQYAPSYQAVKIL